MFREGRLQAAKWDASHWVLPASRLGGVLISKIAPGGLMDRWNSEHEGQVCKGDRIIALNGGDLKGEELINKLKSLGHTSCRECDEFFLGVWLSVGHGMHLSPQGVRKIFFSLFCTTELPMPGRHETGLANAFFAKPVAKRVLAAWSRRFAAPPMASHGGGTVLEGFEKRYAVRRSHAQSNAGCCT